MNQPIPTLENYLPEFMQFIWQLSRKVQDCEITSWEEMVVQTERFFTLQNTEKFDLAVPGWEKMASYANGQTQVHTVCVLVAMITSPDYKSASQKDRYLMEWSALLHDISKRTSPDLVHAFRSAADAVQVLLRAGFEPGDHHRLAEWVALTWNAVFEKDGLEIQDNRKLPEIIASLDAIFSQSREAKIILKAILLHWSFTTIEDWPSAAPLSADEARVYLDQDTLPVLGALILADSDSWNLFDQETKERYRYEISGAITRIAGWLEAPDPSSNS